jgi:hypothetical protein
LVKRQRETVQDPTIIALRDKAVPVVDTAIKPEQVDMSVDLKGWPQAAELYRARDW